MPKSTAPPDSTLFDTWRFHAFFTTADPDLLDPLAADVIHRGHAIIEQVHADLENSGWRPCHRGVFIANAAWLVLTVIVFNLTRAAGSLAVPRPREGDHRDPASQVGSHPVPGRDLRPTHHYAPTPRLTLGGRLAPVDHPRDGPTTNRSVLTTQPSSTARP